MRLTEEEFVNHFANDVTDENVRFLDPGRIVPKLNAEKMVHLGPQFPSTRAREPYRHNVLFPAHPDPGQNIQRVSAGRKSKRQIPRGPKRLNLSCKHLLIRKIVADAR